MAGPKCPICGASKENGSWVQCRRFGALVCERHCSKCRYFSGFETTVVYCGFARGETAAQGSKKTPC